MSRHQDRFAWGVIALVAVELAAAAWLAVIGVHRQGRRDIPRAVQRRLVSELGLGDLALWSDASYCRHPSLAEFFSAHADHPSAIEHFPAGSMVPPPAARRGGGGAGRTPAGP